MRCLHSQTDNSRQFSADNRIVLEDPARDAHELRIIKLTRWPDAFYARFCVGPGLDQAHPCTASRLLRPWTTSTTTACPSPRVLMSDGSSAETWTNTSSAAVPHDEAVRKCNIKTTF